MKTIDWTKWSAISEILSALAIVVTLLYLADQTRELSLQTEQNNWLMRSQTRSDISQSIVNMLLGAAHSEYFGNVISSEVLAQVGGVEPGRYTYFQLANFRIWENIHYQWRNGLYETSEYEAEKQVWAADINTPSAKELYCRTRYIFSTGFRAELNSLLEQPC